ncbi:DNA N-6-adenine-methyltransferase [Lactiplantibacillus plantarum]|uniref:DNA N-6-adenine-methyltransferase n=1 Tax=Lactiplantibacillus plantarum TaxID=1590 RepID=UPI002650DCE8|nr:DNA N-6-adenine-methyltransferase [Lactiplantibacillus plantarum]MDN7044819.1 adenine methyltransferase [Lactiplantibacillus plantarum]MDN7065973.1 adenine methyltransferase [Lactiplantibacillus plantarum]MDN7072080.1 adenine methyltransferase [Lactiplantibacillus plantarum]
MINKALFTSNKEDWETPQDFYDRLNAKYHFEWDLAASDDNAKCSCYFTRDDNSLEQDWEGLSGNLFLNPPYGRELKLWVKKAATTGLKDKQNLVMLIPSRTDTSYWHDYIFNHAEIKFLRGRLKFEVDGISGDSAPFPSAIVIYTGDGDDD